MNLMDTAQLLGNFGEFGGALAVVPLNNQADWKVI